MERRVVITGLGVISPLGNDVNTLWNNLINGKSGIDKITRFDVSKYRSQIGGEVRDFDPKEYFIPPKEARRMDFFAQYAVAATHSALLDSALKLENENGEDIGALIGVGIGGLGTTEEQAGVLRDKGPGKVNPFLVTKITPDAAPVQASIKNKLNAFADSVNTACASGTVAIIYAYNSILNYDAEIVVTGGTEATITPLGYAAFCAMKNALSTRNDEPQKASRPFDKERDGFVMSEGAAMLILESLEHASRRGAKIYAEIIGCGRSVDAYSVVAPDKDAQQITRAIKKALKKSKIGPEQVDYINAHGTSTLLNDKTETLAIKRVFGEYAKKIPISSTKSMTGHLLGAAGGIEAIVCAKTINEGIIHPTINYEFPDPECDLDYVPNIARKQEVNIAMSPSLGFGGHNAVLVFRKYK